MRSLPVFVLAVVFALALALLTGCRDDVAPAPSPWQPVSVTNNATGIKPLQAVHFSSPLVGWLSGGRDRNFAGTAVLLRTDDGGATWTSLDLAALRISLMAEFFPVSDQVLYACAPDQSGGIAVPSPRLMYRSRDGGHTWQKLASTGFNNGSTALHFFTEQTGLSVNIDVVQKTTDGGQSWRTVYATGPVGLNLLQGFASGTAYAAGGNRFEDGSSAGVLLKSTDGGETWQRRPWPHGAIMTCAFVNERVGFAATLDHRLFKTSDGADTWQLVGGNQPAGSRGVFLSEQEGYVAAQGLFHTRDGGRSWQQEHPALRDDQFSALGFSPSGTGIAVTNQGLILKK